MYFGVQMYGVSKEWKQDPEGFLKKIYAAGYRQIEPCLGVRVDARDYGFWLPEDLEQAMPLLEKYHIEVRAVHIFLDEYHYEREFAILAELAQKYHISWQHAQEFLCRNMAFCILLPATHQFWCRRCQILFLLLYTGTSSDSPSFLCCLMTPDQTGCCTDRRRSRQLRSAGRGCPAPQCRHLASQG